MEWPLIGRDRELGSVVELLAGGSAGGAVVAGAAGVGKTRLAAEASQLAASSGRAVEWVRRGEPVPDALRALWKDELCAFVELDELNRGEVERLLSTALGGPVDGRTGNALWELTLGNALFLRELVLYGVERGALAEEGGLWRWRGEIAAGMRLAELVGARLQALGPAEMGALEVVAAPIPPSCTWGARTSSRGRAALGTP